MEELTQANMRQFVKQLRSLLQGKTFSFKGRQNYVHAKVQLKSISGIRVLSNGMWSADVAMRGGVTQSLGTYYATPGGEPVAIDEGWCHVFFQFTENRLLVTIEYLAARLKGRIDTVEFICNPR